MKPSDEPSEEQIGDDEAPIILLVLGQPHRPLDARLDGEQAGQSAEHFLNVAEEELERGKL